MQAMWEMYMASCCCTDGAVWPDNKLEVSVGDQCVFSNLVLLSHTTAPCSHNVSEQTTHRGLDIQ